MTKRRIQIVGGALLFACAGCQFVPRGDLTAAEGRLRVLGEQNQAQLSELANLRDHSRRLEDRVLALEREAEGDVPTGLARRQILDATANP